MRDCFLRIWFAIQCNTIYIFMFFRQILRNNRESLAIDQMQGHLRQLWSTEYIFRTYRIYRIESHRTKHIPSRHLSAIIISAKSVGFVFVLSIKYFTNQFLCTFRTTSQCIQISHMMAWLISMSILPD